MGSRRDSGHQGVFARFFHSEVSGSVVLLAATVVALVWANSAAADVYFGIVKAKIGLSWGDAKFAMSFQHWVNDLLMAVFFFVVGLEVKRELAVGELSTRRKAALPVMAAVGGMVVPAVLYAAFNAGGAGSRGWGIAMATDIAFALGILSVFGRRVPLGLKVFLTALAIADDIGAVLVIAVFYSAELSLGALAAAALLLAAIVAAGRLGIGLRWVYGGLALGVWLAVYLSGVHATVAGILVALTVPVRSKLHPRDFIALAGDRLEALRAAEATPESLVRDRGQIDAVVDIHETSAVLRPPGIAFEDALHPVQSFLILPLFAFLNAGVALGGAEAGLAHPVALGIVVGLVAGKQIGVTLFSWLAVRLGWADLPEGVRWPQIWGAACLAGVGFTMSLFIGDLAFDDPALETAAKLGILAASATAALLGVAVLARTLGRPHS